MKEAAEEEEGSPRGVRTVSWAVSVGQEDRTLRQHQEPEPRYKGGRRGGKEGRPAAESSERERRKAKTWASGHSSWSPVPAGAVLGPLHWPQDVPTAPPWPSPFFLFVFIYLLPSTEFPFHPTVPVACVVLTIPLSHPDVCAALCLSVTRGK